jgi:DNA-directed RNA polymerase sigma subunit (sigma70/sigma32)
VNAGAKRRARYHDGEGRQPSLNAVMTHEEVAERLGVCRQRVVALEKSALRKLRKSRVLRELFPTEG